MPDIFDEITVEQSSPKGDIFDQIDAGPSRARSLVSAPIKGAIKGAHELSELRDPVAALFGLNKMTPMQEKVIQMLLPTQDRPLEKGLERAGRIGVSAIGGPESLLAKGVRVAAGATLGQLAEEVGAPEFIQGLGELAGFASPRFSKQLLPKGSQKQAVDFLRQQGLTDKEIVPLVRSKNLVNRILTQMGAKGPRTEKLIKGAKEKLGQSYDILKETGKEKFLKGTDAVAFDDKLSDVLEKINPRFGRLIEKDVESLRNKGVSQKNLIDFYQDINAVVKGQEGGKAILNMLKKPILEGLEKIDPAAAKQFSGLNEFYSKANQFAKEIKPGIIEKLIHGSKTLQLLGSVAAFKFGFLPKLLGTVAAQQVIRELALNPRLQNLTLQISKSVRANNIPAALRTLKLFQKELRINNSETKKSD